VLLIVRVVVKAAKPLNGGDCPCNVLTYLVYNFLFY